MFYKIIMGVPIVICVVFGIFHLLTKNYLEDSSFNLVIGKPGVGKSTILTMIAAEAFSYHKHVFSTEPITVTLRNPRIPRLLRFPYHLLYKYSKRFRDSHEDEKINLETVIIDPKNLFRYQLPRGSVVLIEEIGICFNNRRYKEFSDDLVEYFKRYRHDHVTFWCASQSMDCDVTIRRIISRYWLVVKKFRVFSVMTKLVCTPRKVQPGPGSPATIEDDFIEDPKLMKPVTGGMRICFIPRWVNMFDSYNVPDYIKAKRTIDYSELPVPYPISERRHRKYRKGLEVNSTAEKMKDVSEE